MNKLIAKIAAHKIAAALMAAVLVAGGVGAGAVLVTKTAPQPSCPTMPGSHPKFIAILLQGIGSYVLARGNSTTGSNSFNAAQVGYCATSESDHWVNGALPPDNHWAILRSMADGWLNYSYTEVNNKPGLGSIGMFTKDPSTVKPRHGTDLINKLADAGGYVLPFSYNGAYMSGTAANPVFHLNAYDQGTVATENPQYDEPPKLNAELRSIHKIFPNVPIVLIGHSNGGLVAEQWWLRYGTVSCGGTCGEHGVTHIYTLDSPINGVADAGACSVPVLGRLCAGAINVGQPVAQAFNGLWNGATSNPPDHTDGDPHIEWEDWRTGGMYTAVGTYGDPLYDAVDEEVQFVAFSTPVLTPLGQPGAGILSQVMLGNSCLQAAQSADLFSSECKPEAHVFIGPCDGAYGTSQPSSPQSPADRIDPFMPYGFTGDAYLHSEAKDCPGTVTMIMKYVMTLHPKSAPAPSPTTTPTPPTSPPSPMNPPADAIAAWKATANDASNIVGAALRGVANLLPAEDTTQIAQLNQLATIPLADLEEDPPAQVAQGRADIKALDTFFGTPGLMPGEGSNTGAPSPTTPPTTPVTPGFGSPGDAVDGFYQGELAGDWAAVCSYVTPSAQALCLAGTSGQGAATGHVTVGQAVISDNEALVSVTGSICAPSTPCVTNSDPSLGMPPSPSQFAASYQNAVANSTSGSITVISPMPCSQINGKWYVDFG